MEPAMTASISGPASAPSPSIRHSNEQEDSGNVHLSFAGLLAALQGSQPAPNDDRTVPNPDTSPARAITSFMGHDLAANKVSGDASDAMAEVFNEAGFLQHLESFGIGTTRLNESVGKLRAIGTEFEQLARLAGASQTQLTMVNTEQLPPGSLAKALESGAGQMRQALGDFHPDLQHGVESVRSNIAQILAMLEGSRSQGIGAKGSVPPSAPETRPFTQLREKLLAMLAQARSTANHVSLEASEEGIRVVANAVHLSPAEKERLRAAIARLIDAYGHLVTEIRLTPDVSSQPPSIGEKS